MRRLSEEAHSRVPVYRGQIDNVVGVLIAKDLFRVATERLSMTAPADTQPPPTIDALMRRPVLFVTDEGTFFDSCCRMGHVVPWLTPVPVD